MYSLDKLKAAFITALSLSPEAGVQTAAYGGTTGWDSVGHMALNSEIEGTFEIMLDTEEVISMSSFGKAAKILSKHGVPIGPE